MAAPLQPCRPVGAAEDTLAIDGFPLLAQGPGVFVDPSSSRDERAAVGGWLSEARAGLVAFLGPQRDEPPVVVVCTTEACALKFAGPTRRSRAIMEPRPTIVVNGIGKLTAGTMLHELLHVGLFRRLGARHPSLPAWFEEGLASYLGDNIDCAPRAPPGIDDLRRLSKVSAWQSFTNLPGKLNATYCQARAEVAGWAERRGRPALVEVIDAVAEGRSFDEVYGALTTTPTPDDADRLDARFALDENDDSHGVDATGRPHLASLLRGATWAKGHRGFGVKVTGGAYLRADDLFDFGLPDKPFTVSLWAKPLTNTRVLVHTAVTVSGDRGWCLPLLGYDRSGHLVAQVPFASEPQAFLAATGPVLPLNRWSHLAVSWSAEDGVRLYVNGSLAGSRAPQTAVERKREAPARPMRLFVGGDNDAQCWPQAIEPGPWNGFVDELHVYNHALTREQLLADMHQG